MVNELPSELIALILGEAYYLKDKPAPGNIFLTRDPDRHTLAACCRVNSTWRAVAQPLLFHHITVGVSLQFSRWLRYTQNISKGLLESVRTLELRLNPVARQFQVITHKATKVPSCTLDDFCLLLSSLPCLYELEISFQGHSIESPKVSCQSLRALRINECSVQSPVVYELLSLFPGVRFLALAVEIAAPPPPNMVPNLKLYELVIYRTLLPEITEWLVANSVGTLRVLELREFVGVQMSVVLRNHYTHLQSLRLLRLDKSSLNLIQSCSNLRELVLVTIPGSAALPSLSKLPESLQHLSLIRRTKDSGSLAKLADVLGTSSPQLELVSCDRSFEVDPEFHALVDVCSKRGIELRVDDSRHWPNEEPVEVSRFPRERTMLNFLQMRP